MQAVGQPSASQPQRKPSHAQQVKKPRPRPKGGLEGGAGLPVHSSVL